MLTRQQLSEKVEHLQFDKIIHKAITWLAAFWKPSFKRIKNLLFLLELFICIAFQVTDKSIYFVFMLKSITFVQHYFDSRQVVAVEKINCDTHSESVIKLK